MIIANLPIILRMLLDHKFYRFIVKLYKLDSSRGRRSFYSYIKYLLKFCYGEKLIYFNKQYIVSSFFPPLLSKAFFTFINSLNKAEGIFSAFSKGATNAPISTYLKITNQCNYKCVFCSANYSTDQKTLGKKLSVNDWKKIISDLQDLGTSYIGFTGGEPLLYDGIEELITSVDDRAATILFTNGLHLSYEKACTLKKAGLFALSVSLDSAIEKKHNEIRGNEKAFSAALQAIANSRKAGLYTIVQSVIFKEDLEWNKFYELLKLVKKQGAHELRIHQPAISGKLLDSENKNNISFTPEDRKKLYALQFRANKKLFNFPKVSSFPYTEGPERFGCNAGIFHSYITDQGELTPCDFIPFSFGNVLENKITDLYKIMKNAVGNRKMSCMASQIAPYLTKKELPLPPTESAELCKLVQTNDIPKFFRDTSELL